MTRKIETYSVHVRLNDLFEDVYVDATSPKAAIAAAKKIATLRHCFAVYVV